MAYKNIIIKGAREHNLKNIDLILPRNKFIVFTGLSGSGKSSLAFDTIYAEGQRRYVESLSTYARQFLGQMEKPDVESIEGLSPAISIEQKTTHRNPRSTVATVTEIYDHLRLLFARIGKPYCPQCAKPITSQTSTQIIDVLLKLPEGAKLMILAPLVRGRKGEYKHLIHEMEKEGFARIRIDGQIYNFATDRIPDLDKNIKHKIEVVVDRLIVRDQIRSRLADSVETALRVSEGLLIAMIGTEGKENIFSQSLACLECGISIPEISPRLFSFNSPYGACKTCHGLGKIIEIDPKLVIVDPHLSLMEGAVEPFNIGRGGYYFQTFQALAKKYKFSLDTPYNDLPEKIKNIILYGTEGEKLIFQYESEKWKGSFNAPFEGVINNLHRRYKETRSEAMHDEIARYMSDRPCHSCDGKRLKPEALSIKINSLSIIDVTNFSVSQCMDFFENIDLGKTDAIIAKDILKEIRQRLKFLKDVGLDYLTLDRESGTLSGGEAQRIRLATQIGSRLVGVVYILDEPSIGLHQRDNKRLLETLRYLNFIGNTLIVIEHDEETIRNADHIVDLGPGAGDHGGEVVAQGTIEQIMKSKRSITGKYLRKEKVIPTPKDRRKGNSKYLSILGARMHNLKDIDVKIPLGKFVAITGVSGSGKSTLLGEILYPELARTVNKARAWGGEHDKIQGIEYLDKVINIDQSPIGRTPRSNPATYTGTFTFIRDLYSRLPESKIRGYKPGRFSFNVRGGRCEACEGQGILKIEMHFLPDIYIKCEECQGKRFNKETLHIKYKDKNIADVLNMTVEESLEFFKAIPAVKRKLKTLQDVGLGYIKLGQSATTLSGGEAQRIKLASELAKKSTGKTFYILDEPTTGLHFHDIKKLLDVLNRFVDSGNTVVVIEHNLDVIKMADHIIDLGPEGGDKGGYIIAEGSPEKISKIKKSYTGNFLKKIL
ncbi:MAG: excinuclease ABC subunit UvrA [Spirochaetes bacterium]|nr:excinuclease ABC subunit UvrA [Spirochaetota bacterium]